MNPYRHITATNDEGVLVLTVKVPEVKDYMVAQELKDELIQAVKRAELDKFVLDLQNMAFMTSLACVAFIGVKHAVRERQGRLVLCNMSEFIRKVFDAKRLLHRSQHNGAVAFEHAESLNAALAMLAEDGSSP